MSLGGGSLAEGYIPLMNANLADSVQGEMAGRHGVTPPAGGDAGIRGLTALRYPSRAHVPAVIAGDALYEFVFLADLLLGR